MDVTDHLLRLQRVFEACDQHADKEDRGRRRRRRKEEEESRSPWQEDALELSDPEEEDATGSPPPSTGKGSSGRKGRSVRPGHPLAAGPFAASLATHWLRMVDGPADPDNPPDPPDEITRL